MSAPDTRAPVILIGGGGHAKVVADNLLAAGRCLAGYTDRQPARDAWGLSYLGTDDHLEAVDPRALEVFVALGDNRLRARISAGLRTRGFTLANAIHPSAQIAPSVEIGTGVAIMANVAINAAATIGDGAIVNTAASVDHDCRIGAYVHLAPGSHLAGCITIGEGTLVGVGAAVGRGRPLGIGAWSIVGTGAVVVRDVPAGVVVVGNPARPLDSHSREHAHE